MTRNRKVAISSVFDVLTDYASLRGSVVPQPPPPAYRTIYGDTEQVAILTRMTCSEYFRASAHVAMGIFEYNQERFVGVMGFDFEPDIAELGAVDVGAGAGIVMYLEFDAVPKASPLTVVNIVSAQSSADDNYLGHDFESIRQLFPSLQLFEIAPSAISSSNWPLLLRVAIGEAAQGGSWVGAALQQAVCDLADLQAPVFPYAALCRAIFDLDPRNLFMALYRCIEATYARDACEKLRTELGLRAPWYELAVKLDRSLGWRAAEAASINTTLINAAEDDLRAICDLLAAEIKDDLSVAAGRAIYRLRNKIVHFRASDDQNYAADIDWDLVCKHMAYVVRDVFGAAFVHFDESMG